MQYIKDSQTQQYVYCKKSRQPIYLITLFEYLIQNNYIIDNELNTLIENIKRKCETSSLHNYISNTVIKHYHLSFLDYYLSNEKLLDDENAYFFKDKFKNNLHILNQHMQLFEQMIAFTQKYNKIIAQITLGDLERDFGVDLLARISPYRFNTNLLERYKKDDLVVDSLKSIFDNPFTALENKWLNIINQEGDAFIVESTTDYELFNQVSKYAVFCEHRGVSGYAYEEDDELWYIVPLSQAQLFTTMKEAYEFIDRHDIEGVVCEIHLKFEQAMNPEHSFEKLDSVMIYSEQEKLDKQQSIQEKIQALKELMANHDFEHEESAQLHVALDNYLKQFSQKTQKKKKL